MSYCRCHGRPHSECPSYTMADAVSAAMSRATSPLDRHAEEMRAAAQAVDSLSEQARKLREHILATHKERDAVLAKMDEAEADYAKARAQLMNAVTAGISERIGENSGERWAKVPR